MVMVYFVHKNENLYSPEKPVAKILKYGTQLIIKQRKDNQFTNANYCNFYTSR